MQDDISTFLCELKLLLSYCEHEEYSSVNCIYGLPVTVANAMTMLLLKDKLGLEDTCGCPELLVADSPKFFFK